MLNSTSKFNPVPSSNKESVVDIRSNKAMKNYDSRKNGWERSIISELTNNDKISEQMKEKSISKIKENLEGEDENSQNNTQNYLLIDEKQSKGLFMKATFKEDEFVTQDFNWRIYV